VELEKMQSALKIFEAVRHSIENQIRPLSEAEKATKKLADSNLELPSPRLLNQMGLSVGNSIVGYK
jgi:hypothetical protein